MLLRLSLALLLILTESVVFGKDADSPDIVFTTPFRPGQRPKEATFFLEGENVGTDRDGFQKVLDRVQMMPRGASIVWGPNYARCGACSGSEPSCLARHLFPDLWKELESIAADRGLTISRTYPVPRYALPRKWEVHDRRFRLEIVGEPQQKTADFDLILDWQVGERSSRDDVPRDTIYLSGRWHRIRNGAATLDQDGLKELLSRLPQQSRVLIRNSFAEALPTESRRQHAILGDTSRAIQLLFPDAPPPRKTQVVVAAPAPWSKLWQKRLATGFPDHGWSSPNALRIRWHNFHGKNTLSDEVLYFVDGQYVGRGNIGIDAIFREMDRLPRDAQINMPRYELSGRAAFENYGQESLKEINAELARLVPFAKHKDEFDRRLEAGQLHVTYADQRPPITRAGTPETVHLWEGYDALPNEFVGRGRIIRHDDAPQPAAALLDWTNYDAHETGRNRAVESAAVYRIDGAELGAGVAGFEAALERLAALPEQSVIQVRVCLKTKGPFLCPIVYKQTRHFERTGIEPYLGLFPLLINVIENRRLQVHWLPDEGKSCGACPLNK
jgi:hypothetical protein